MSSNNNAKLNRNVKTNCDILYLASPYTTELRLIFLLISEFHSSKDTADAISQECDIIRDAYKVFITFQ